MNDENNDGSSVDEAVGKRRSPRPRLQDYEMAKVTLLGLGCLFKQGDQRLLRVTNNEGR